MPRAPGQLREGLRYIASKTELGIPLLMMGLVGMLAYEFQVSLPVMARSVLHQGPEGYGLLTLAMGLGAVAGGLVVAARGKTGLRPLVLATSAFGAVLLLAALAPNPPAELAALTLVGWASIALMSTGNSTLQLQAEPAMRGRVMSLWFVAFQGSTPIGAPIIGAIIALAGARIGLATGAITAIAAALLGALALRHTTRSAIPPSQDDPAECKACSKRPSRTAHPVLRGLAARKRQHLAGHVQTLTAPETERWER